MDVVEISECGVGGDSEFISLLSLPKLPLTEAFGPYDMAFPNYDQELVVSSRTGHVQLRYQLDPGVLYSGDSYAYRSAAAAKTSREMALFEAFIVRMLNGIAFGHVLEVGANDLSLARQMSPAATSFTACDPLLMNSHDTEIDGIRIIGTTIERAVKETDFKPPDLVLARHTLEHVADPRRMLRDLMELGSRDVVLAFEVPSLRHLVEAQRFDAVFHQHFHYFDMDSIRRLIWEVGGEYVGHQYNFQGSNGGSLMFAFRRGRPGTLSPSIDVPAKVKSIKERIALFTSQMYVAGQLLEQMPGDVYGFGAGHMLATLDYHLDQRLKRLICVLDDDPEKDGFQYRNVDVKVRATQTFQVPDQASYVITSMENVRSIYQRIQSMNPRRILVPQIA